MASSIEPHIPESILLSNPEIPVDSWERLSASRFRAPHPTAEFVRVAVVAFGETVSCAANPGEEAAEFATLFEVAARSASQRLACVEGTPQVRPDNEWHRPVAGRCFWCGEEPADHESPAVRADRAREEAEYAAIDAARPVNPSYLT